MPVGLIKTGAGSAAVYTVNGGAGNAPDWLARKGSKKGKSRARDEDADPQGIRLIQVDRFCSRLVQCKLIAVSLRIWTFPKPVTKSRAQEMESF